MLHGFGALHPACCGHLHHLGVDAAPFLERSQLRTGSCPLFT